MTEMDSDWMAGSPDLRADFMRCRRCCRGAMLSSWRVPAARRLELAGTAG